MLNKDNYMIWCTYHNEDIPKKYNLYNSEHFKLYNDDDLTIAEDNINYLHDYLCDLTTYYYVWKNQIKSDYIGFCHYGRHIKTIDYDIIDNVGFYHPFSSYNEFIIKLPKNEFQYLDYNYFMYLKYKYNIDFYNYMKSHKYIFSGCHNIYVFKWDVFCVACDFIFGYLDYIFPDNRWKLKSNIDYLIKFKGNLINGFNEIFSKTSWYPKILSVWFELTLSVFLGIRYNCNEYYNKCFDYSTHKYDAKQHYIICKDNINENNIEQFKIWYNYNIKSGITDFVIKSSCNKDNLLKELHFTYIHNVEIYNENDFIKVKNNLTNNNELKIISLHLNERIHCDSSIEMYKGNYYIEKIPNTYKY